MVGIRMLIELMSDDSTSCTPLFSAVMEQRELENMAIPPNTEIATPTGETEKIFLMLICILF